MANTATPGHRTEELPPGRIRCAHCQRSKKRRKTGDDRFCSLPCEQGTRAKCTAGNCQLYAWELGMCTGHAQQARRGATLGELVVRRRPMSVGYRDEHGRKLCIRCEQWLPTASFGSRRATADKLASYCRECSALKVIRTKYGVSADRYREMLVAQGGGCAICGTKPMTYRLAIDHDHRCCPDDRRSCGKCVRGLLCGPCNVALGMLQENPDLFAKAAEYLTR